ncbi:flagellar assembly protein FliW [Paenibacillus solani]|uniref:Flagellar assembly factor FliW n=1 Tax=Paenibacillus solani TaxID=1705565 RepID=A0A0M1N2T9_9BACL|nr:flagellar assembly protein FliW [Paenibacillus solani]KOR76289.1 flagellar assembly factor fliw [Paenibacillus solani]
MIVETAQFGQIEVPDERIFSFEKGIPGFESHTRFAVIELQEGPFAYLQSLEDSHIALLITEPFMFYKDYEFDLPESVVEEMNIESDLMIRNIVTLNVKPEQCTINLLAPLVFNIANKRGRQVILHSSDYKSRHPLWPERESSSQIEGAGE